VSLSESGIRLPGNVCVSAETKRIGPTGTLVVLDCWHHQELDWRPGYSDFRTDAFVPAP
jgi:hypothetical protein